MGSGGRGWGRERREVTRKVVEDTREPETEMIMET